MALADAAIVRDRPRMVDLAPARGIRDAPVGDVQDLRFDDDAFDTAIAAWMLFHIPDLDRRLIRRAREAFVATL